jgi:N-acetylglucosamine kinase-like BadF-type ATPase
MSDSLFLGIDGGGTKTEAVITNHLGKVIGRGQAPGSNPHNLDFSSVTAHITQAISTTGIKIEQFQGACLGIAGLDNSAQINQFRHTLATQLNAKHLDVYNDGYIGFRSGSAANSGICLIASTGNNCYGLYPDGHTISAGDWGYLLGDEGSGFFIGQSLLKQTAKEYDGRQELSALSAKVYQHYHLSDFASLSQHIYSQPSQISVVADLAKIINSPELANHPYILSLTTTVVDNLYAAFETVYRQLQPASSLPLVLVGKLFLAQLLITKPLLNKIYTQYPATEIIFPTISPAEAAAVIAQTL